MLEARRASTLGTGCSSSGARAHPSLPTRQLSCQRFASRREHARMARALSEVASQLDLSALATHLPLMYEPIAGPCSLMNCGDVVHRSTLDRVLRMEQNGPNLPALLALATASTYLFITPGVLAGFIDFYVLAPLQRIFNGKVYDKGDLIYGKLLGKGGFGAVYLGELVEDDGSKMPVVIKKANEFGEAEVWMNERMMRAAPSVCAEFVTAFTDTRTKKAKAKANTAGEGDVVVLVWKYEGPNNLSSLMMKKDFPYNMEPLMLKRELKLAKGPRRASAMIKLIMRQLMEAVRACHRTGIVHRDIKPENCIISEGERRLKLIDFGAAADLRIGINYNPVEYLLDPRYAPPEQYIMSVQTPKPPPKPVAAFLSPILWRMNNPDRFDTWSIGITMLQLAFAPLRNDNNLIAWKKKLADSYNYDLRKWRRTEERSGKMSKELAEGFAVLDLDGRAGWELLCSLVQVRPENRISITEALLQPWLSSPDSYALSNLLTSTKAAVGTIGNALDSLDSAEFVQEVLDKQTQGFLTEAQLAEELGYVEDVQKPKTGEVRQTIAWFQERQADLSRKQSGRRNSSSSADSPGSRAKVGSSNTNGRFKLGPAPSGNGKAPPAVVAKKKPQGFNFMDLLRK